MKANFSSEGRRLSFKKNRFGKTKAYIPLYSGEYNGSNYLASKTYVLSGRKVVFSFQDCDLEAKREGGRDINGMICVTLCENKSKITL